MPKSSSGAVQALPPIVVTGTKPSGKRGRSESATPHIPSHTETSWCIRRRRYKVPGIDADKVPASVNVVDANQIKQTGSLNIGDALVKYVPGIIVNEVAGNPFQPNVQFRGFVASPVSGTPQGLAVYQNGVRINEAFGDTVNWDLIPTAAIQSVTRGDQQSRVRPQCARRRGQRADEGRLQLSRRRDRHDGRLVRAHPELGAVGQADRQCRRLRRA